MICCIVRRITINHLLRSTNAFEQGEYLCSVSTMHRLLRELGESVGRWDQRPAQHHAVPKLLAHAPNEVWTWDITKLPLIHLAVYLSLYVVLDLFNRYVVAWMVSHKENSTLASQLMDEVDTQGRQGMTSNLINLPCIRAAGHR